MSDLFQPVQLDAAMILKDILEDGCVNILIALYRVVQVYEVDFFL